MTARRGSFRFKVKRLAGARFGKDASVDWHRRLIAWTRFGSRVIIGAAILMVMGAFGAQSYRIAAENYHVHQQITNVERRNDELSAESARLQKTIVLLHDPDYLVPLIHEQLGLVKPHEVMIIVAPTAPPSK